MAMRMEFFIRGDVAGNVFEAEPRIGGCEGRPESQLGAVQSTKICNYIEI